MPCSATEFLLFRNVYIASEQDFSINTKNIGVADKLKQCEREAEVILIYIVDQSCIVSV